MKKNTLENREAKLFYFYLKSYKKIRPRRTNLAGVAGFEPTHAGVKVPCLTAWLHPIGVMKF